MISKLNLMLLLLSATSA
jgi:hypothetical protein